MAVWDERTNERTNPARIVGTLAQPRRSPSYPQHKKDFEEDVIVELKSTKVDDEFPVKLYGGDL